MNQKRIYATGMVIGSLELIRREVRGSGTHTRSWWLCRCKCGMEKWIRQYVLLPHRTISCGCVNRVLRLNGFRKTHGGRHTVEYARYCKMISRCCNPLSDHYDRYGGRGITVAAEWRNNFPAFLAHIGPIPSRKHSIERIDNNRGYEPGNVRWATQEEQMQNKCNTIRVVLNGEQMSLRRACRLLGIAYKNAHKRFHKSGIGAVHPALGVAITVWDQSL